MKHLASLPTRTLLIYSAAATACCGLLLVKVFLDSQTINNQAEGMRLQTEQIRVLVQSQNGGGVDYNAEIQKMEKIRNDRYKNDYKFCTDQKSRNSPNSLC